MAPVVRSAPASSQCDRCPDTLGACRTSGAPGPDRAVLHLIGELGQRHRRAQYI
jgi:hypothetical protein